MVGDYHVEVKKRYDWGIPSEHRATVSGGGPGPLGMNLEQADIAHLHSSGMARDFDVSGTCGTETAGAGLTPLRTMRTPAPF